MRFFSHAWATMDYPEAQAVIREYGENLKKIDSESGLDLGSFTRKCDLRGSLLDRIEISESDNGVKLDLIVGDNQVGYSVLHMRYSGANVCNEVSDLERILDSRSASVRFDEFDFGASSSLCHRLLIWPRHFGEIEIQFSNFSYDSSVAAGRFFHSLGDLVIIDEG